jgi:hypothetical protein
MSNTMTSSTATSDLALIQVATLRLNYYGSIAILAIGTLGCLCNFITFTAPQLRHNSCAFYFLAAAVFELCSITFGLISRFPADNLGSTLLQTDQAFCKLRAYLVSAIPLVATYLVLLASIDRCLSSSVHARLRAFSRIKVAYRATLVAVLIGFASCSHILFSYDLRPRCGTMPGGYAMFDGLFVVIWLGVIPHMLMLVFGVLTVLNIRRAKRKLAAHQQSQKIVLQPAQRIEQKKEKQLIVVSDDSKNDQLQNVSFIVSLRR